MSTGIAVEINTRETFNIPQVDLVVENN